MSLTPPTIAPFTRRRFLAAAGATAFAVKASALQKPLSSEPQFAYAASPSELRVYTQTTPWTHIQSVASEAPVSLVVDVRTHTLHVLHHVAEHQSLPCGYIESFRIDHRNGRLTPLSRQPLSLSGIHPRHMALAPNGKTLAVAIHGGSAYNLLPILEDGRLSHPIAIRKETGLNTCLGTSSPSRPGQIVFDSSGSRIFALDHGTATLSVFATEPALPVLTRFPLPAGSHPSHFALDAERNLLYMTDPANGSVLVFQHDSSTSSISPVTSLQGNFTGPLAFHTTIGILFAATCGGLTALAANPVTGALKTRGTLLRWKDQPEIRQLYLSPNRDHLLALTESGVIQYKITPTSTHLSYPQLVATASHAIALL